MKTLKLLFQLSIILIFILFSCNKDEIEQTKIPGYFSLTELSNKKSTTIKSNKIKKTTLDSNNDNPSSDFNFGDLKASKEFLFMISNGGDQPIFDIKLSMNNSSFNITPSSLGFLPGSSDQSSSIVPVLTLGITHGINLNGIGYTDLLPMNINTSKLTLSGKTISDQDTIDISDEYSFSVNSKIMDIELYNGEDKIDLLNPNGSSSSNLGGLGFIRMYKVDPNTNSITIKNTGNTVISLYYGDSDNQNNLVTIQQSESATIDLNYSSNTIILDSEGTITDDEKIQLGNDGKGYFSIMKYF